MTYRIFGRTGVLIGPLALGSLNFGLATSEADSQRIIYHALDNGINVIDTSNSYSNGESERIVGQALAKNRRRQQAFLATKAFFPTGDGPNDRGNSRLHLMQALEDSLRRLQTDHIDLYQLHRPDPHTPIDESMAALSDMVRQGKVRYIGTTTFPAWGLMEAVMTSELKNYVRFVSEQPPYNLLDRRIENETIPFCQKYDVALLPWSPLAMGVLAGRYDDAEKYPIDSRANQVGGIYAERVTAEGIRIGRKFSQLAREANLTPAQLAVLWVKDQPAITAPIIGPRTFEQLDGLLPVMEMQLSDELRLACDALVAPGSVVVDFYNSASWMKMKT